MEKDKDHTAHPFSIDCYENLRRIGTSKRIKDNDLNNIESYKRRREQTIKESISLHRPDVRQSAFNLLFSSFVVYRRLPYFLITDRTANHRCMPAVLNQP